VAMSRTVESLSREIARDLQGIAEHMTVSGYDLRAIQEALKSTGYDPGPADGIFGPRTREAIRRFQGEHGVRVTGEPSGQLQNMLMAMP
jgi:peptidoglycan hydrolase-like protein with peptidoglycan-binding domain